MRASEERYRRIVETTLEGIWTVDPENRTTFVNQRLAAMLGYAPQEMIGLPLEHFVVPEDREAWRERMERARRGEALPGHETRYRRKDGTDLWAIVSTSPIPGPDSRFAGSLGIVSDITQRKKSEDDHARLQAQLNQSQKMEAIGLLAGGVAHDFNNMLTVILGYSDVLLGRLRPEDPNRTYVADIRDSGQRAASLTRQLLAFSRKQILAPEIVDLNEVVSAIEKMLRRLIGEDIVLTTIFAPLLPRVRVDPGQMEQVIINLAVNARDAMPQGGRLIIETTRADLDQEFCRLRPGSRPGPFALVSITDTGTGMTPEVRSRVFEPFFTTKEYGKGTGLGLATVFGIIKQSEGYIDFVSEVGAGTSFRIYIPAVEAEDSAALSVIEAGAPPGHETVLLVEDEEGVRQVARLALESFGYKVIEAANSRDALSAAEMALDPIDLVLTDIVMPGMSGRQLAESLQKRCPGLKVLFMSGYTDDAVVRHGVTAAAAAYLHKPFPPLDLARKVREVLDSP